MSTAGSEPEAPTEARALRYAVVFKTYAWDPFIERQARRWAALASRGDFFISADETNGSIGRIPFQNVSRTTNADLIHSGLANRFERGSLLWWNADYVHYHFFGLHPDYDFYLFVEYDALFLGDLDGLVQKFAASGADLAALPLKEAKEAWAWTKPHLATYSSSEVEGCLVCISALSHKGLELLQQRRHEMTQDSAVTFWPSAEVFLPTEIKRARLKFVSLESFGNVELFNWRPPLLEQDVGEHAGPVFLHPVYDQPRYVRWMIEQAATLRESINPRGPVLRTLSRFPLRAYLPGLTNKVIANFCATLKYRLELRFRRFSDVPPQERPSTQP